MNGAADLITARAAISAVQQRFLTATDDELLANTGLIEEIGRMVDGLRVAAAAEIEHRSRPLLGVERLSFRSGAKDGVQLVEHVTRVSHREAKRRVGIGAAIAPRRGLLSETLPSRLPDVTDAVNTGMIGLDAARVIVELWKETRLRAEPAELGTAVQALVHTAQVVDVDGVKEVAAQWRLAIDPSGAKPIEQQRHRSRALRIGDTLEDGTTRVSAIMLPEHLALLREFLQAARRSTPLVRTEAGSEHPDEPLEPEWREDGTDPDIDDPRSKAQQDYDTLVDGIALAAKAQAAGFAGTSTTHQVVITVTADELAKRDGHGWAPGLMVGLPMPTVEQIACTAETRLQVDGANGEPLFLSRTHRLFTPAQKLSLITSAGGRCEWPGCTTPAPFLEAHHVAWFNRDGGLTDVDNGIMLCSHHHHVIHAPNSPVEIRRWEGDFYVVPTSWAGAPDPSQRRRERIEVTRGRIWSATVPWYAVERRPEAFLPPSEPHRSATAAGLLSGP